MVFGTLRSRSGDSNSATARWWHRFAFDSCGPRDSSSLVLQPSDRCPGMTRWHSFGHRAWAKLVYEIGSGNFAISPARGRRSQTPFGDDRICWFSWELDSADNNVMSESFLTDWKIIDRLCQSNQNQISQPQSDQIQNSLFSFYIQCCFSLVNIILVLHHESSWIMNQGSGFIQDSQLEFRILNVSIFKNWTL